MAVNIFTDQMQHAQLFGRPVLTTNWLIPRETVPDGWYCYDMQGTDRDPTAHATLVDYTSYDHSGTVLSPKPLKRPSTTFRKIGPHDYFLHGETMELEAFCEEYGLDVPENPIKFEMRPATPEEAGLFYALPPEKDAIGAPTANQRSVCGGERRKKRNRAEFSPSGGNGADEVPSDEGAIGHVRIDFGRDGDEFWHTWWPRGPEGLNTPEFREELGQVVDQLRRGVLKDFSSMLRHCHINGGQISGGTCCQNYGFVVETERYRYCLRCNPVKGDYQAYLTCFDLREQELNMAQEQGPELDSGPELGGMG